MHTTARTAVISIAALGAVLSLACAGNASAGLFGGKKADASTTTAPTQAAAQTPAQAPAMSSPGGATTVLPPADQDPPFQKATPDQIDAALRSDPLTQSAFFADQYDHDPTNVQMGLYLSNALRGLGRYAEAADTAHRALLFAPDNVDILIAAARAHIDDDNAFYAVDPLQHALTLKPNDWQLYSLLGVAYDQIKREDDAQTAWATALKLSPNNPAVLTNIAMSKVTQGDFAGAEPLLRTAVAQKDSTLQIRQNLALVLGLEGKMDEAERLLRQDLPPDQADANLAWLQANLQTHQPAATTASASTTDDSAHTWGALKSGG